MRWIKKKPASVAKTRRIPPVVEWAIVLLIFTVLFFSMGIFSFSRYRPTSDTKTVDRLLANLPETRQFSLVDQAGKTYVVWIGRPRGPTVSGPPVYVFDDHGDLVDDVCDAGDSDNAFVGRLYGIALNAPSIEPREAAEFCRKTKAGGRIAQP